MAPDDIKRRVHMFLLHATLEECPIGNLTEREVKQLHMDYLDADSEPPRFDQSTNSCPFCKTSAYRRHVCCDVAHREALREVAEYEAMKRHIERAAHPAPPDAAQKPASWDPLTAPIEEVDAELRREGIDPEGLAARGLTFIEKLKAEEPAPPAVASGEGTDLATIARNAWHADDYAPARMPVCARPDWERVAHAVRAAVLATCSCGARNK